MAQTIKIDNPIIAILGIVVLLTLIGGIMYFINGELDWLSYLMLGVVGLALLVYVVRNIASSKSNSTQQPQQRYQQVPPQNYQQRPQMPPQYYQQRQQQNYQQQRRNP
jgi:hypothetical protein